MMTIITNQAKTYHTYQYDLDFTNTGKMLIKFSDVYSSDYMILSVSDILSIVASDSELI
jgi:hypothetical protein